MNEHTLKLLYDASNCKFVDILSDLEYNDLNINASDQYGTTLLHYASEKDWDSIIIKILQNVNVIINIQDNYCRTPLHYAADFQNYECMRILLARTDIKVNIQDLCG